METRREKTQRVLRNVGSRVSKLRRAGERDATARSGHGGAHLRLSRAPGSRLGAPAPPPSGSSRPAARASSSHAPAARRPGAPGRGGRAGRRHAPRRRPGSRPGLAATPGPRPAARRRCGRRARFRPGGALGRARPLPALCPLAPARGRLPAFRGPALGLAGFGAGPPGSPAPRSSPRLGPQSRPRRLVAAPQAQTRAHRSRAGLPRPALNTVQFQAGTGSGALAAGCSLLRADSTASEEKEGGRPRAGWGWRRRKGGEMEEEGGTESSLLLPAARSLQAATAGNLCCPGKSEGSWAAHAGGGG